MKQLRKNIYATAGYNTISLGTGRKEFNPKKPREGLETYIKEAGQGAIKQISDVNAIDEVVISNFMAARFNRQGNLAGFAPIIDPSLRYKPSIRVEGACGTGGLGLITAIKTILSDLADVVLVVGVEVQNTVKAIYGADILAGAGYYNGERKNGHAYFFPNKFSERAGAYFEKYGKDKTRQGMAHWYKNAIEHARREPNAQEFHNVTANLVEVGLTPPDPNTFLENLNVYDCSKVSDGASAMIFASEEGLKKIGILRQDAVKVVGLGQVEDDITLPPPDLTQLTTSRYAAQHAYTMAGITKDQIGVLEVHDCFSITGLLMLEATGFTQPGETADFVIAHQTRFDGRIPTNSTGGLIGFGHYTGGTGIRQAVDLWRHLSGKAGDAQAKVDPNKPFGLMVSMGGNDKTVVSCIFEKQ